MKTKRLTDVRDAINSVETGAHSSGEQTVIALIIVEKSSELCVTSVHYYDIWDFVPTVMPIIMPIIGSDYHRIYDSDRNTTSQMYCMCDTNQQELHCLQKVLVSTLKHDTTRFYFL